MSTNVLRTDIIEPLPSFQTIFTSYVGGRSHTKSFYKSLTAKLNTVEYATNVSSLVQIQVTVYYRRTH